MPTFTTKQMPVSDNTHSNGRITDASVWQHAFKW